MDNIIIYGIRPVIEAIKADVEVHKIWLMKGKRQFLFKEVEKHALKKNIELILTSNKKIDKISKKNHQGAAALISPIKYLKFESLLQKNAKKKKQLYLLLDGITDVRNFGAIFRNSLATGVNGIIVPESNSANINPDTVKASAGAIFYISTSKVKHLNDAIYELKSRKFEIIG